MAKLACKCGNIIYDQTDDLPYKAGFFRDQDSNIVYDSYIEDIFSFIQAIKLGDRDSWIIKYFNNNDFKNLDDKSIINDIILRQQVKYEGKMYQCVKCGRILVETRELNKFGSFIPEGENWKDILKGLTKEKK